MSLIQKVRTYVYDTPATYNQFDGGINTNLSNEALEINELRDGLNCHYVNQSLVNRKGEKVIKKLLLPITTRPQGDFIFSAANKDYIISVRNGHIFYGDFTNTNEEITMNLLSIEVNHTEERDDCTNYLIDLETKTEIDLTKDTEGFIYKYYAGNNDDPDYIPEEDEYKETIIIQNTKRVQGVPVKKTEKDKDGKEVEIQVFILATGLRILKITEEYDEELKDHFLYGRVLEAYEPNSWEYQNIGVNNLSPFPSHYISGEQEVPLTSIGQIKSYPKEIDIDTVNNKELKFEAVVNCLKGYDKHDLHFKWEAKLGKDSTWTAITKWKNSDTRGKSILILPSNFVKDTLNKGENILKDQELFIRCTVTSDFQKSYDVEKEDYYFDIDKDTDDYISDQAIAQYSKTHISKKIRAVYDPNDPVTTPPDREFLKIHSCTKVVNDGSKLLFYDDAYNSCEWFKTVVGVPNYLSYGGNLSFRTSKNEKLIGVCIFDKNIVVFSDNEQLGGNISVVTGNGDDYNDGDYYSPYKRTIVNTSVSCDAFNTIQVAENYIIFKYRKDIYMLDTNDLDAERVQVITINDKVKQKLNNVEFPLDRIREPKPTEHIEYDFHEYNKCLKPDEIFSEVYDGFYGLVFPHQGNHIDTFEYPEEALKHYDGSNPSYIDFLRGRKIENISVKPGLRWKCYFRKGVVYQNGGKTFYPWLRDTSKYLNICNIITINGESTMITYDGELVQFNNDDYSGLDEYNYKVRMSTRCYDMELPTLCKFMDNVNVYYNRDFTKNLDIKCYVKNEASYYIYTPNIEAFINDNEDIGEVKFEERYKIDDALNLLPGYGPLEKYDEEPLLDPIDKPVQVLNEVALDTAVLDRPSFTSITLTPKYRFPYLSSQFILEMRSNQAFSLSSLTFSFTSNDMPDFTREKLYREILKDDILK